MFNHITLQKERKPHDTETEKRKKKRNEGEKSKNVYSFK